MAPEPARPSATSVQLAGRWRQRSPSDLVPRSRFADVVEIGRHPVFVLFVVTASLVFGHKRMDAVKFNPAKRQHFGGCIQFHGAGSQ